MNTALGATVVVLAIGLFLLVTVVAAGWRAVRRRSTPIAVPAVEPPEVLLGR